MVKLWKENKLSGEWQLEEKEIVDRFLKSEQYKSFDQGFPLVRALAGFISDPGGGLNSYIEADDYEKVMAEAYKII